ncbi:MAG: site-2 protease family protein [Nitrospirae bacterium]|nr:site-2 protease family protein [Nitrospirota bacterium]
MDNPLQHGSWKIATVMGIPIRVHFSWLVVLGLITWSLSAFYFPKAAPELPVLFYWIGGLVAALLLFVSVALHELSHSLVALKYRLPILNITLFIFGGVSQMKDEPPGPKAEFRIALAGPLSSLVLAFLFFLLGYSVRGELAKALFAYISRLNLVLGLFNLIPGFPMDGGRVVRAFIWKRTGNFLHATRRASGYGRKIALLFILSGLLWIFAGFPGGLWMMLIGWFLHTAAQSSYQQASLQQTLQGVKVRDIMTRDIVSLPSDATLDEAVNGYFLKHGYGGFPVVRDGRFLGFVTLKEIKDVPRERWREVKVAEVLIPHRPQWEVSEEDDAVKALELMIREDAGRLVVTRNEELAGLITRNGIAKYVQIMEEQR